MEGKMPEKFEEGSVLPQYLMLRDNMTQKEFLEKVAKGDLAATVIYAASRLAVAIGEAQMEIVRNCSTD
jgi:hypothetical protein